MNLFRRLGGSAIAGDRLYVVALAAVFAVSLLMLSGPVQHFLDGRERLDLLESKKAMLSAEISRLEERGADLRDRDQVELLARRELGLVKPGEMPYVVVTPEPERPLVAPAAEPEPEPAPWYRRLWREVAELVP